MYRPQKQMWQSERLCLFICQKHETGARIQYGGCWLVAHTHTHTHTLTHTHTITHTHTHTHTHISTRNSLSEKQSTHNKKWTATSHHSRPLTRLCSLSLCFSGARIQYGGCWLVARAHTHTHTHTHTQSINQLL